MMKVLLINSDIQGGSVGRIVCDIYEHLISENHDCKIYVGRGNKKSTVAEDDFIKYQSDFELYTHYLKSRLFGRHGLYSSSSTRKLIKYIDSYKPDIINIHSLYGYFINYELLLTYLADTKIPVVLTMHSCWDITGHCCYFDSANCNQWKSVCKNCKQINSYPQALYDDVERNFILKRELFNKLNCTIVTPSKWLANIVQGSYLSDKHVEVINNGIDIHSFKMIDRRLPIEKEIQNKKVILGVAGVWDKRKGLEDFYRLNSIIDNEYKIVLIGLSKKQISELPNGIIGIERTESIEELAAYYSRASVFFNPTYEDNYPTVNLESVACGTPYVTYDTGGSGELIDLFRCGFVIGKGEISALKEEIKMIDKIKCNTSMIRQYISKNRMCEEYRAMFEELTRK